MARPNEHLAVLLPRHLWKPDAAAAYCDNFYCRAAFSLFERRHHCRKCGGVFCRVCTPRTTALLDTAGLDFLLPPRNVPIATFDSPQSRVLEERVCDDCYDQVHGLPATPRHRPQPAAFAAPGDDGRSIASSSSSSTPALSRKSRTAPASPVPSAVVSARLALVEKSYGELDAYPLRRSSVLCKATGGGRWEPKQQTVLCGYRPPGGKAPYEIELEAEEQAAKMRRLNPVVKDGDFQYRFPPQLVPEDDLEWSSRVLSTF